LTSDTEWSMGWRLCDAIDEDTPNSFHDVLDGPAL
jgi:hypothetical protein